MRTLIMLAVAASLVALAGCNTMQGLGKDLEQLGDNIQRKANR